MNWTSFRRAASQEACSRLLAFVRPSAADETLSAWLAEGLAGVANDAPDELLAALKAMPEREQGAAVDALVAGLVKVAEPNTPWWPSLKAAQGSADPTMVEFARSLETTMSQKIAASRAPGAPVVGTSIEVVPPTSSQPSPGG